MSYTIRPIERKDNEAAKALVVEIQREFGCVGPGYSSSDPEMDDLYTTYSQPDSKLYLIEETETGAILGCGGFARLKGTSVEESVCELQKLYFHNALRGQGFGKRLTIFCMHEAAKAGFGEMYLESIPQMQAAVQMYEKLGFQYLVEHRGATGHHHNCPIRMDRRLENLPEIKIYPETDVHDVIPAKAGISLAAREIPTCVGMTGVFA